MHVAVMRHLPATLHFGNLGGKFQIPKLEVKKFNLKFFEEKPEKPTFW